MTVQPFGWGGQILFMGVAGPPSFPTGAGAGFPMSPRWTSYVVPKSPMTYALCSVLLVLVNWWRKSVKWSSVT